MHLLIDHKQPVDLHKERGSHYSIYVLVGACWSSGMILASGARGPGFDSRTGPKAHVNFVLKHFPGVQGVPKVRSSTL